MRIEVGMCFKLNFEALRHSGHVCCCRECTIENERNKDKIFVVTGMYGEDIRLDSQELGSVYYPCRDGIGEGIIHVEC